MVSLPELEYARLAISCGEEFQTYTAPPVDPSPGTARKEILAAMMPTLIPALEQMGLPLPAAPWPPDQTAQPSISILLVFPGRTM
jgi:hypothetical protein